MTENAVFPAASDAPAGMGHLRALAALQDAYWRAYEDHLLDAALAHAVAAQDEDRKLEILDAAIRGTPADRT